MTIQKFQRDVWGYYRRYGRDFPWRRTADPYQIIVSELMLQQTQVSRVLIKYKPFLKILPDFHSVKMASLKKVLRAWQGLGYNRRALALKRIAVKVIDEYGGVVPHDRKLLSTFPGIGKAIAGAICAFAFNMPVGFIETNIRRVYIDAFFPHRRKVSDKELLPIIEKTLDKKNPREWYWALMDYGAALGKTKSDKNPNKRSAHYRRQSAFAGSRRELRGRILKYLLQKKKGGTVAEMAQEFSKKVQKVEETITALAKEGFVTRDGTIIRIVR